MDFTLVEDAPTSSPINGVIYSGGQYPETLNGSDCIVVWHGGLMPGQMASMQPKVAVIVKKIDLSNEKIDGKLYCLYFNADLIYLSARVGDIFRFGASGRCQRISRMRLVEKKYVVDCRDDYYEINTLKNYKEKGFIQPEDYRIFSDWSSWIQNSLLIRFQSSSGVNVFVSSLEWLRTYGFGPELKRTLLTYPWEEAENRMFQTSSEKVDVPKGWWYVCLGKAMVMDDIPFLAHVKNNEEIQKKAKKIYSSLAAQDKGKAMYPVILPWNDHKAKITVNGVFIEHSNSFLVLNLNEFTYPPTPQIYWDRGNPFKTGDEGDGEGHVQKPPIVTSNGDIQEMDIEQNQPPDHNSPIRTIRGDGMIFENKPGFKKVRRKKKKTQGVNTDEQEGNKSGSTDEKQGTKKLIDQLKIIAAIELTSHGTLYDMWAAFQKFSKEHKELVDEVCYFTFKTGFVIGEFPKLVSFPAVESGTKGYAWVMLEKYRRQRGCLVMRFNSPTKGIFYVIELERLFDDQNREIDGYQGLVFTLSERADFNEVLATLMWSIVRNAGKFDLSKKIEGINKWQTFMHKKHSKIDYPCENVIKLILHKMDITVE